MQEPKIAKNSPSAHHRTTLSGCFFATEARIDNRKNLLNTNISSTCPHIIANVDALTAEIGLPVWGTFQQISCLGFLTAAPSVIRGQPNFARCLAVSWASTNIYIFGGSCPLTEFCQVQNSLTSKSCVLLYWQRNCTALEQRPSAKLCGVVPYRQWNFGIFAEGATYIRLGGHHVGHRPTF